MLISICSIWISLVFITVGGIILINPYVMSCSLEVIAQLHLDIRSYSGHANSLSQSWGFCIPKCMFSSLSIYFFYLLIYSLIMCLFCEWIYAKTAELMLLKLSICTTCFQSSRWLTFGSKMSLKYIFYGHISASGGHGQEVYQGLRFTEWKGHHEREVLMPYFTCKAYQHAPKIWYTWKKWYTHSRNSIVVYSCSPLSAHLLHCRSI